MKAFLTEVLRFHPSVPIDGKFVVKDDILPDGTKVYKNELVMFSPAAMGLNPKIWKDPEVFNPLRFVKNESFEMPEQYD